MNNDNGNSPVVTPPTRNPRLKSDVWAVFERVEVLEEGVLVKKNKCGICKTLMKGGSDIGSSHLRRHLQMHEQSQHAQIGQMQIGSDSVGNLTTFAYDKTVARKEIVDYVIRCEQPFTFVESHDFKGMIQRAFCPRYTGISASTSYSEFSIFKDALAAMKAKFDKYWAIFPLAFCFATVMDPRFKLFAIGEWLSCMGVDQLEIDAKLSTLKIDLHRLYESYRKNVVSDKVPNMQSAHLSSTTLSLAPGSIAVPVVGGRVVSEKRARLSPSTIEALICLKDWSFAKSRIQDAAEEKQRTKELMNIMAARPDWMQDDVGEAGIDSGSEGEQH
ncbi:hypothetical protein M0R45_000577 [Rubus argutus]|uniref:BED-type domain-containing protein n=1 Tax=Rubus argutus TaxID=59490 RepID=A0AAW1VKH7_RUBAR